MTSFTAAIETMATEYHKLQQQNEMLLARLNNAKAQYRADQEIIKDQEARLNKARSIFKEQRATIQHLEQEAQDNAEFYNKLDEEIDALHRQFEINEAPVQEPVEEPVQEPSTSTETRTESKLEKAIREAKEDGHDIMNMPIIDLDFEYGEDIEDIEAECTANGFIGRVQANEVFSRKGEYVYYYDLPLHNAKTIIEAIANEATELGCVYIFDEYGDAKEFIEDAEYFFDVIVEVTRQYGSVAALESYLKNKYEENVEYNSDTSTDNIEEALTYFSITEDMPLKEAKKIIRKKMFKVHPDQGGSNEECAKANEYKDVVEAWYKQAA